MAEEVKTPEAAEAKDFVSAEESEQLSKVLFPDTDTTSVTLLGSERQLRPLPIKYSKQIHALLEPVGKKIAQALTLPTEQEPLVGPDIPHEEIVKALQEVAKVCATFYNWAEVKEAAEKEELSLSELQSLAVTQSEVSGRNDFLLGPLRLVIKALQIQEVVILKFQNLLTTPPSATPSTLASTV